MGWSQYLIILLGSELRDEAAVLTRERAEAEAAEPGRLEFHFPLLTVRTTVFSGVFNRLGALRTSGYLSWVALALVPLVAGPGLYLIFSSLVTLLWTPAAREIGRELGPGAYVLIPGINPYLPLLYGWLALVVTIVIHEGMHGVVARHLKFNVKSSGLLFFLVIPIGAFVDVDEEQIAEAKPRDSARVMAAGVGGNIAVAGVCLLCVLAITSGLTPIIDGVYVFGVLEEMPAEQAGLLAGDVVVRVDHIDAITHDELTALLEESRPGDILEVTVARGDRWADRFATSVELAEYEGRAFMGVTLGDIMTENRLTFYQSLNPATLSKYLIPPAVAPGVVPFSEVLAPFYVHPLRANWVTLTNIFFWLWFVNVYVAIFNALPIYPLDGGRLFMIALQKLLGRKTHDRLISGLTYAVTITLIGVLLLTMALPFIL
jgi:membrane-associated protease RseP (regulator of RpoE activity)